MAAQCDYTGERACRTITEIVNVMKSRPYRVIGCTQRQIADEVGISVGTVSRYLVYMMSERKAHIHAGAKWKNGAVSGATYKHGPDPRLPAPPPKRPRRMYMDIPLAFFRSTYKMNKDKTGWFKGTAHKPGHAGPYECRIAWPYGKTEDEPPSHFRWFDKALGWSHPLEYDPDVDDTILRPTQDQFIGGNHEEQLFLERFDWRGFVQDQDEL